MRVFILFLTLCTALSLRAANPVSKIVSGTVLLGKTTFPEPKTLISSLQKDWKIKTDSVDINDKTIVFSTQGVTVMLAYLDYPAPQNEVQTAAAISWLWKTALQETAAQKAQIVVSVIGTSDKSLELYKLFTRICGGVLSNSEAIGVLMSEQLVVVSKEYYLQSVRNMTDQNLPVYCWVYFGLVDEDNDKGGFTFGLKEFGLAEMEIVHSSKSLQEVHSVLLDAVQYVLQYNVALREGQMLPLDGAKVKASLSKAVYLQEGNSVKLSY